METSNKLTFFGCVVILLAGIMLFSRTVSLTHASPDDSLPLYLPISLSQSCSASFTDDFNSLYSGWPVMDNDYALASYFSWDFQIIDVNPDEYVAYSSLALDSSDLPHVSFITFENGLTNLRLRYAYLDEQGWHIDRMNNNFPAYLSRISLAIDAERNPHIAYHKPDNYIGEAGYAYKDVSGWHTEGIASGGTDISLTLDSSGSPYMTYAEDGYSTQFHYATKKSGSWEVEQIERTTYTEGLGSSLVLDSLENPHMTYYVSPKIGYSWWDNGWIHTSFENPPQDFSCGDAGTALKLDREEKPHVLYLCSKSLMLPELKYAVYDNNRWQITPLVSDVLSIDLGFSLDLDLNDQPHVAFQQEGRTLQYLYDTTQAWHSEIVDGEIGHETGSFPSMQLDSSGHPHIAYVDRIEEKLHYARALLEYRLYAKEPDVFISSTPGIVASDYTVQTDLRFTEKIGGQTGLIFGLSSDGSQFYTFEIDATGQFAIYAYQAANGWRLLDSGQALLSNPGDWNHLQITRQGTQITAVVNDSQVSSLSDGQYTGPGYAGLLVISSTADGMDVRFDNFRLTPMTCLAGGYASSAAVTRITPQEQLGMVHRDLNLQARP